MAPPGKGWSRDGKASRYLSEHLVCGDDAWRCSEPIPLNSGWQELARVDAVAAGWSWVELTLDWPTAERIDWRLVAVSPDGTTVPNIRNRYGSSVLPPVSTRIAHEWSITLEARYTGTGTAPLVRTSWWRHPMPLTEDPGADNCCDGGCEMGNCHCGDPDALVYENHAGNAEETDPDLLAGNLGPGGAPQIQDRRSGAAPPLFRSGAWSGEVPPDPVDRPGGGIRVYGPNSAAAPMDATHVGIGNFGHASLTFQDLLSPPVVRVLLSVLSGLRLRDASGRQNVLLQPNGAAEARGFLVQPDDPLNLNRPAIRGGDGSPEGLEDGARGSLWVRTDTGNLYQKLTAAGTLTGWQLVGGGGGSGIPLALAYFDGAGNLASSVKLLADRIDPYGRPCIQDMRAGGAGCILRLGSWGVDGDPGPTWQPSDGVVVLGADSTGGWDPTGPRGAIGRLKSTRVGIRDYPAVFPAGYDLLKIDATAFLYQSLIGGVPAEVATIRRSDGQTLFRNLRVAWTAGASLFAGNRLHDQQTAQPERQVNGSQGDISFAANIRAPMVKIDAGGNSGWAGIEFNPGTPATCCYEIGVIPTPGDSLTIADPLIVPPGPVVYEWNASNPPAAGTPGTVWLYVGLSPAEARDILFRAINGIADLRINPTTVPALPLLSASDPALSAAPALVQMWSTFATGSGTPAARDPSEAFGLLTNSTSFFNHWLSEPASLAPAQSNNQALPGLRKVARWTHLITFGELISGGPIPLTAPFPVAGAHANVDGTGVLSAHCRCQGFSVLVTIGGSAAVNDILYVTAWS